jgi:hypothetical protein
LYRNFFTIYFHLNKMILALTNKKKKHFLTSLVKIKKAENLIRTQILLSHLCCLIVIYGISIVTCHITIRGRTWIGTTHRVS